jgi:hypothetical protein
MYAPGEKTDLTRDHARAHGRAMGRLSQGDTQPILVLDTDSTLSQPQEIAGDTAPVKVSSSEKNAMEVMQA